MASWTDHVRRNAISYAVIAVIGGLGIVMWAGAVSMHASLPPSGLGAPWQCAAPNPSPEQQQQCDDALVEQQLVVASSASTQDKANFFGAVGWLICGTGALVLLWKLWGVFLRASRAAALGSPSVNSASPSARVTHRVETGSANNGGGASSDEVARRQALAEALRRDPSLRSAKDPSDIARLGRAMETVLAEWRTREDLAAVLASPPAGGSPAGWYPDPQDTTNMRLWDGTAWTDQRQPVTRPLAPASPPTPRLDEEPEPDGA